MTAEIAARLEQNDDALEILTRLTDLPFDRLRISPANPSRYGDDSEAFVAELAKSIKELGLLHPLTLVSNDAGGFDVIAGARRLKALQRLRRDDPVLRDGEYTIFDSPMVNPLECAMLSDAENQNRRPHSYAALAKRAAHLASEGEITQEDLSITLKVDRGDLNRMLKYSKVEDRLPEGWITDLGTTPGGNGNHKPAITPEHFKIAASEIQDGSIRGDVLKIMRAAHDKKWSTREFKQRLDGLKSGRQVAKQKVSQPAAETVASATPAKPEESDRATDNKARVSGTEAVDRESCGASRSQGNDPIAVGKRALSQINAVVDALTPTNAYSPIPSKLINITKEIERRIQKMEQDRA